MNLRPRRRDDPEVNLTSLIDVVFLLLLFFLLSTTFNHESNIHIDLPKASQQPEQDRDEPLTLSIDATGNFYLNGQQLVNQQLETLKRALDAASGADKKPPLVINADGKTPHQAVVTAMDAARQVGLVHLSIATQQPPKAQR